MTCYARPKRGIAAKPSKLGSVLGRRRFRLAAIGFPTITAAAFAMRQFRGGAIGFPALALAPVRPAALADTTELCCFNANRATRRVALSKAGLHRGDDLRQVGSDELAPLVFGSHLHAEERLDGGAAD